jgi:glycosyltransferase involved in cell wall biosynthesis
LGTGTIMHEEHKRVITQAFTGTKGNTQDAPVKVSVCMISYNHEPYIRQAIESILSQDVDFQIELVISDDCSPDGTAAICVEFARRDPRVRLLPRDRNLGVMGNFSRALMSCTGEYIAVCEGDDYWTNPQKLRKQVQFLDAHPTYAGTTHQSMVTIDNLAVHTFKENVPSTLTTADLIGGRLFHTASVMFRRPAIDLFCESPPVLSCDRLLNICISLLGKVHYSRECMCVYRRHGGGMSYQVTSDQLKMDLNCIPYLSALNHEFPKYRYKAYVFATIGLLNRSSPRQKLTYSTLAALYSFSYFPNNLFQAARWLRSRLSNASQQR